MLLVRILVVVQGRKCLELYVATVPLQPIPAIFLISQEVDIIQNSGSHENGRLCIWAVILPFHDLLGSCRYALDRWLSAISGIRNGMAVHRLLHQHPTLRDDEANIEGQRQAHSNADTATLRIATQEHPIRSELRNLRTHYSGDEVHRLLQIPCGDFLGMAPPGAASVAPVSEPLLAPVDMLCSGTKNFAIVTYHVAPHQQVLYKALRPQEEGRVAAHGMTDHQ
mmetsp:Transcript_64960/g.152852  ORF Transcript_64960/g.152852 Transcript_64960/m.152852 type:complete len:224 (+) Transcript_64960:163-834(+)